MPSNIFNIKNGVVASGSVTFPNLTSAPAQNSVLVVDSNGRVYTTGSGAGGGSGTGAGFPFSGSAVITGSLLISGSTPTLIVTGTLNVSGGITASLQGTASWAQNVVTAGSATNATNIGITNTTSTNSTYYLTFVGNTSGNDNIEVDSTGLTYNPSTNTITSTASFATTASFADNINGGSTGYIPKWTGPSKLDSSLIYQNTSTNKIGIGTTNPTHLTDIYSSNSNQILKVAGSGSSNPIFLVEGSQGELFSVTDNISGSLFSVNDKSGLPIIDVISDSTILMGNYSAQSLNTTVKFYQLNVTESFYQIPTASYDAVFVDYYYKDVLSNPANVGCGVFLCTWLGNTITKTQNYNVATGGPQPVFDCAITGEFAELRFQTENVKNIVKAIIRSI